MRIALVSARVVDNDVCYNLNQIIKYMQLAKAQNANLVCFGETFLQGFNSMTWNYEEDRRVAISLESDNFKSICKETKRLGIDLLFGFIELMDSSIYSSCALISDGELLHLYRRISKGWKEYSKTDFHYKEGTDIVPFSYRGKMCLIALCGDLWEFPERFRLGEDLLFWPVYISFNPKEWKDKMQDEYSRQAQLAYSDVLLFNSIGDYGDSFGGCFRFVNGKTESALDMQQEGILFIDV